MSFGWNFCSYCPSQSCWFHLSPAQLALPFHHMQVRVVLILAQIKAKRMFPRILSEFAATVTKVTDVPVEALFSCGFNIVPADFGSFPDGCLISNHT